MTKIFLNCIFLFMYVDNKKFYLKKSQVKILPWEEIKKDKEGFQIPQYLRYETKKDSSPKTKESWNSESFLHVTKRLQMEENKV